ncbi:hypothetical protein Sgly_0625 [Syntrophobotulus glycolicus DSM 8271]|uniref:Uncharacterized protein n=1 Tax=Syntrophobotulus glycolicus (strain DSM 8271 / FlGlyR) TaxID=645991 RepID=F0SZX6_SYNGF|nr:hypothetical protein [Syntrophobotulus glycolicus]ADY54987.1 hypothetical protein Sgly_0625 [Syntrophobotulus glycolicus DSM 8271]
MMDLVNYYRQLFLISWPAFCLFLSIMIFFVYRFALRMKAYRTGGKKTKALIRMWVMTLISLAVMIVFGTMFLTEHGEWLEKPGYMKGKIKEINSSGEKAVLTIDGAQSTLDLFAEKSIQEKLNKGDIVELFYIPGKKVIYQCNFLTEKSD